ncbi:MAG: hypothetical protein FWC23_01055 [Chitinispirillia bacterium]|nr:hypothetical protein [Chitinispirillia bacterium]MCL2267765.1 hypothetical protein [Chitinispirillia bacterium]
MSFKRLSLLIAVVMFSGAAFAQQRPADLTVSKAQPSDNFDGGMFRTIQAAVNAAKPGQIIEILDSEVYEEQVTIDGRGEWDENSVWTGVKGGKNGITIRSSNPTRLDSRPTIRFRDTQNRSPRTYAESRTDGELPGSSGNFETCGALRIIRAQGVTIDGIIVDGGGAAPFGWTAIWDNQHPLFHGNAAITLVVASGAVIRNCEMKNAYFGVNVKDRNTGGVFGNPNPADNDNTVPLSGFGKVGSHLIEYNRVNGNSVAFFFESAWDLGSTIRYNLIYDNFHTAATLTALRDLGGDITSGAADNIPGNQVSGAFLFKDMVYTPVAIYNNTLYNNTGTFFANWKVSTPHLIFNNIFSKPYYAIGTAQNAKPNYLNGMGIDHAFPFRMNNCLFSASDQIQSDNVYVSACRNTTIEPQIHGQQIPGITRVSVHYQFTAITGQDITSQITCLPPIQDMTVSTTGFVLPGAPLTSAQITADKGLRWLETVATTGIRVTEDLFVSTSPASPDFLRPKWDHQNVISYIKNRGWDAAGIRNSDGQIADIGAIPSTGRQPATVARIKPSNVVLITGTTADASFYITLDQGQLNNPRIKFLRWVSPLPVVTDNWGSSAPIVPSASVITVQPPANYQLSVGGNNTLRFTVPPVATGPAQTYGFFEMVIEGTDASGNQVTTDVGFLPYRTLSHFLDIEVHALTGTIGSNTRLTEVRAGDTVRLRVSARENNSAFPYNINEIDYSLVSDATAAMLCVGGQCPAPISGRPLTYDTNVERNRTYQVVFTKAGEETIRGAGLYVSGTGNSQQRLSFLGITDITVRPGKAENIVFKAPIPKAQLPPGALPQVINRGSDFEVLIEVQDRFGNAVDTAVRVDIVSNNTDIGDAGAPGAIATKNVMTSTATGLATFNARVTNGVPGQTFDMTATLALNNKTDVGALRVGRTLDMLQVFYSDTGSGGAAWRDYYRPESTINGATGQWFRVTVKAVSPDTVINSKNGCVRVESDMGIVMSAEPDGVPATTFAMTNGVAKFWVSAAPGLMADIADACLDVYMMQTDCSTQDNGIQSGNRCGISFIRPVTSIHNAVVFGNGLGRPDSVYVRFAIDPGAGFVTGSGVLPDSAMLKWPTVRDDGVLARGARISAVNDTTIKIDFAGINTAIGNSLPMGYTDIPTGNASMGLVTLYGGSEGPTSVADLFEVLDGIGPVIASTDDYIAGRISPMIVENLNPGVTPDTLILQLSEQIFDEIDFVGQTSVLYTNEANPPNDNSATGGTQLNVTVALVDISGGGYKLVLAPGSAAPAVGGWVRLNSASNVRDVAAVARHNHQSNAPHPNSRWVKVEEKPVPPDIVRAWYTANVETGKLDYAYITFNKSPNLSTWFSGGYFKFNSDSLAVGANTSALVLMDDGVTLRIDLSVAHPSSQRAVMTGGGMSVTVGFTPAFGWMPLNTPVIDRAKPVLADTVVLKIGAVDAKDTLIVVYSEALSEAALRSNSRPVIIIGGVTLILKDPVVSNVSGTSYMRVTYVIDEDISVENFPTTGDQVYINPDAGLVDMSTEPNTQDDPANRRVTLKVERGSLKWDVIITSNPLWGGNGNRSTVTLSPNAKGAKVEITAKIRLYNNMGNVVIDTVFNKVNDMVEWAWDGHNRRGRMVGTGTYLFKAVCDAVIYGADGMTVEKRERYTVTKPMGFVRGKR